MFKEKTDKVKNPICKEVRNLVVVRSCCDLKCVLPSYEMRCYSRSKGWYTDSIITIIQQGLRICLNKIK